MESKLGRHLIPTEVRDAAGAWTKARNPLDQSIEIPKQERFIGEHLAALFEAVSRASQVKHTFIPLWIRVDSLEILYGGKGKFAWGTEGSMVAREALIALLDPSSTSFFWNTACSSRAGQAGVTCLVYITDLMLPQRQPDGKVTYREQQFDRAPIRRH